MKKTGAGRLREPGIREIVQEIIDCIYDRIYIMDNKGEIILANRAAYMDNDEKPVTNRSMRELMDEWGIGEPAALKVLRTKKAQGRIIREPEGYDLLAWAEPCVRDGQIKYVVTTEWDLGNLRIMESFLRNESNLPSQNKSALAGYGLKNTIPGKIIANGHAMRELLEIASCVARSDATVLIQGETGTGKEVLMRYIHAKGDRIHAPLIEINCAAIPENLVESELFGYVKGAFTGADAKGRRGVFELANCGTVFLDEVQALPLHAQAKLLRVLQEKEITRVGGHTPLSVDVKIIAASNVDLKAMANCGQFREDLYYRLNVLPLNIPPLRERKEDIGGLIEYFSEKYNEKYKTDKRIDPNDFDLFLRYDWPGNVRELQNLIERVFVITRQKRIERGVWEKHLSGSDADESDHAVAPSDLRVDFRREVDEYEKHLLLKYISNYENSRQFGKLLGLDKSTVNRKLGKYQIRLKGEGETP
jgi:transcriptional regulator with PAS, ATPase and Fis domain